VRNHRGLPFLSLDDNHRLGITQATVMSKFVVVVFPSIVKAYDGMQALKDLHSEGSLTLYSTAVIERTRGGGVAVKEKQTDGPVGIAVGALIGGLIGLFASPVGAAIGLGSGASLGALRDLFMLGVSDDFLEAVGHTLKPGTIAVVAEIAEERVTPLDIRMAALGGTILREPRTDFVGEDIQRTVAARKAEVAQRRAERAASNADKLEAKLEKDIESAREELRRAADRALARLDEYKLETDAKLDALYTQANEATPAAKAQIEQRIAEIRADQGPRIGKLEQAWQLTQDALGP
jgi:uncharacterized membrane protein